VRNVQPLCVKPLVERPVVGGEPGQLGGVLDGVRVHPLAPIEAGAGADVHMPACGPAPLRSFTGDASLEDAVGLGEEIGAPENLAWALCERSLVAMAHGEWSRAEVLAARAGMALRRAGIDDSRVTVMLCAARARVALHRGDVTAVRRELVDAQRLRALLTYAIPHLAVQARIELARVHLALADLAGSRTLMREVDELLRRRPDLGTLVGEAEALRAQLSRQRGAGSPGASALTAAELRVLPLLASHLPAAEIAAELFVSVHNVKSQQASRYRKLGTSSRSQAVARARQLGLLEG